MMFFTVLGVIAFIYLIIGVCTVCYGFYIGELDMEEVKEDPFVVPFAIIGWPMIVLDELGYL